MLSYKPHTFTVSAIAQDAEADGAMNTPTFGAAATYSGMVYPMQPGLVFERFGVESARPTVFMADDLTEATCPVGSRITFDGELYHSVAPVQSWSAISPIAFTVVIAEKAQFQGS